MLNTIAGRHASNIYGEDIGSIIAMFAGSAKLNKCEVDGQPFDYDRLFIYRIWDSLRIN